MDAPDTAQGTFAYAKRHQVSLYPAGHYTRDITFAPSMKLPAGWQFGTALEQASQSGDTTTFKPTTYNTLVDSPVFAGIHFKRLDLAPGAKVPVHMDIVADASRDLDVTPKQLTNLRDLVTQANRLFGSHHYGHFDFLVSLSDYMEDGLEHHQSSENGTDPDYFTDYQANWPTFVPGSGPGQALRVGRRPKSKDTPASGWPCLAALRLRPLRGLRLS